MALFPIIARFEGDFVPHLVAIDTEDDMAAIAQKAAVHTVGRRLPADPEAIGYEVLLDGRALPATMRFSELSVPPLQWFDVRWRY